MMKIESKDINLEDLKLDCYSGFFGSVYRILLEVPADYIQRADEGTLMAFNVTHTKFYDFMLGVKKAYVSSVTDGVATIEVEIGESYLSLALRDLNKVKGAFVLIPKRD
jgi:hypothetical protein